MYHVMIVDDELYARTRLKVDLCLERDGFLVDQEAANGQEALEKMRCLCPDILLTDMCMPDMNGADLIEQVKRMYPDLPVIVLSGYEDYAYVRSSLKLGAIDYLLKHNLNREVVLKHSRNVLNRFGSRGERIYGICRHTGKTTKRKISVV